MTQQLVLQVSVHESTNNQIDLFVFFSYSFLISEQKTNQIPNSIIIGSFSLLLNVWFCVGSPIGKLFPKSKTISNLVLNSFSGLGSSRRHLQSGNSLSGSLHYGINSDDDLPIPQPPLPPTSVPPHLNHLIINCTEDDIDQDLDDDEEEEEEEIDLESEQPIHMHHQHQHHAVLWNGYLNVTSELPHMIKTLWHCAFNNQ